MKIALLQLNPTIGALKENTDKLIDYATKAYQQGARVAIASETIVCGYPPKDLLEREAFLLELEKQNERIEKEVPRDLYLIFGTIEPWLFGNSLHGNVARVLYCGYFGQTIKTLLPNYDVFDDARYFGSGDGKPFTFTIDDVVFKVVICEDSWGEAENNDRYKINPLDGIDSSNTDVLINLSGSPFTTYKLNYRGELFSKFARERGVGVILVNQVGGNDELIFDGRSSVWDNKGNLRVEAKVFEEDLVVFDYNNIDKQIVDWANKENYFIYNALVLGVRDYAKKCGFTKAVIGLSGGIDSAVTAAIAVDALGPENVLGIGMPSEYSSEGSVHDAAELATNLGMIMRLIPIKDIFNSYQDELGPKLLTFDCSDKDVTYENLQARIRGNILMAISNRSGALVLTTGNKSEIAVGYCTLYGDMCGGLAVISDVPKTKVYELAKYINREQEIIPLNTITKPPSAELAPDQKDTDSLPPYEILDEILRLYIEEQKPIGEIVANGFEKEVVEKIAGMVQRNEYKRKQMAPGLIVTSKAFGIGRRMPVACGFKESI